MIKLDTKPQYQPIFKGKLHPLDLRYKQLLREGIQDTFQFSPKIEALDSIVGPMELKILLKKFTKDHFATGTRTLNKMSSSNMFDNVRSGNFQVNLHVHTRKSDGCMTPQEYLEMSNRYANKVAQINPKSNIPAYTSATTDHNNFDAAKEIIASIAEEPQKYKNFKFVPGCEFMFNDASSKFKFTAFEGVGLSFNPFDKELQSKVSQFNSIELIKDVKKDGGIVSYAHPIQRLQGNGCKPEFIKYLKSKGIEGIEANYQYNNFVYDKKLQNEIKNSQKIAEEFDLYKTGGTDSHSKNIFGARALEIIDELI